MARVISDRTFESEVAQLLGPQQMYTRTEVLERPSPIPAAAGVYAWYFDETPPGIAVTGCHSIGDWQLLYVGISPKAPSRDGLQQSRQNLRTRVRYHFKGNAAGSTLRLTLGSLLADRIGIRLRQVGSGKRLTFSSGEAVLSDWMTDHARVCWAETMMPWVLESQLIESLALPLNLDQNKHCAGYEQVRAARAHQRTQARRLEILPR